MGATRLASGIFQQPRPAEKCNAHTQNKDSQTALNTRLSVSLFLKFRRETASPPLVLAFRGSVSCLRLVVAFDA